MKRTFTFILAILSLATATLTSYAQTQIFHTAIDADHLKGIDLSLAEDSQGYIWFGCRPSNGPGGLYRYGGPDDITAYLHNPDNDNSLANNSVYAISIDSAGMIWVGTIAGLDRFDPATQTFTHYRHDPNNPASIANDSIYRLAQDQRGNLWIGTRNGLDEISLRTGKFTHFKNNPGDSSSLGYNVITTLFTDRKGDLWIGGWGLPEKSGLDFFNTATRSFTHYRHDPSNPQNLSNDWVTSIYEDSYGNLWVGTMDNGLQTLNRKTGQFTHYPYNPDNPMKFGAPPLMKMSGVPDDIPSINEDDNGNVWIGSTTFGLQKYNPLSGSVAHYGNLYFPSGKTIPDRSSGFSAMGVRGNIFKSKNGLLWIPVGNGRLFYLNPTQKHLPYYPLEQPSANAFYQDENEGFWIATDVGLLYRPKDGKEKLLVHDPKNTNSLSGNGIATMIADKKGNLWLGTYPGRSGAKASGLDKMNIHTRTFTHYLDSGMTTGNGVTALILDNNDQSLWVGADGGLYELNISSGKFIHHYRRNPKDSNSLGNNVVYAILPEGNKLWVGTNRGLDLFDQRTGQWEHFLKGSTMHGLLKDSAGVFWAGTQDGLYRFNSSKNKFDLFKDSATGITMGNVMNILEDNNRNLWVSCANAIYRLSANRDALNIYGTESGVHPNTFLLAINYQAKDGKLFLGDMGGYYSFYPDSLDNHWIKPELNITGFQLGGKLVVPGKNSILSQPVYLTKTIELKHNQNSFSFEFSALHFDDPGEEHYRYKMEGIDSVWHDIGTRTHTYFFNMPVGHYTLRIRAVNPNGAWAEKDMVVIVNPPWWATWWAISIYVLLLIALISTVVYIRSRKLKRQNQLLEEKVNHRTEQLRKSLEELKSTQKQLVQSEKMASLGELTAGIAHEIQNPLNFVNNFSELNGEMLNELNAERSKPVSERDDVLESALIKDIRDNEEKILHHGRRADAIVKSMLLHSRSNTGQKESTDINVLCDEYLRLSYHGLRAKDKSFNATMKTEFDESIGKINVVPQDIGRVLLNIINNAFFAVAEKKKLDGVRYEPTVTVSTKNADNSVIISVRDNGNGIPEKIKDKIFQPFFTTKPTGSGTGLGLSLAYDIIKAHGGTLKVESLSAEAAAQAGKEGKACLPDAVMLGTAFSIQLPA